MQQQQQDSASTSRPSAAGRKLTAVDRNPGVSEDLKPSAPNKLSELHKPVATDQPHEPQTLSYADPQPPVRAGGVSPTTSMDAELPSSSSLRGSKESPVRSERGKLGQSQSQAQTLAQTTTTTQSQVQVQQQQQQQEFHERGDVMRQISEVDRRTDRDFFLSLATTKAKEARRAPWGSDGHPLMQAAASGDGDVSENVNDKAKSANSSSGHGHRSKLVSVSASGLNLNAGAGASVSASCVDVQMILEELGPLESVTQVYARDFYGRTPLHIAALNGCAGTVYHLMNSYRKNMFRTGVQDNIARLERERVVSAAELRAALIASGAYSASSWDLKVKRMNELASKVKAGSTNKTDAVSKGSTIPQLVALQHWFDEEVERVHRAHEVRVEVYRTKLLSIKDKFGRTPLHYACACGCPPAVLEALLNCSTACVGISHKEHSHFNMQHANAAWDVGKQHLVRNPRSLFSSGVIYESATGMEIGRTDGLSPSSALAVAPSSSSIKEATRLINKSLRNVAWELTHEQSALGAPAPVKQVLLPGQRPGEEQEQALQKVPRDDSPPATFAEDQEQMFEVIVPWVCRNVLSRAADLLTRDKLDPLKTRSGAAAMSIDDADAKGTSGSHSPRDHRDDAHRAQGAATGTGTGSAVDCFEKLHTLIAEVQLLGSSALLHEAAGLDASAVETHAKCLLVPELNHLLGKLGIQVTKAVVAELCVRYPAGSKASSDKWKAVQQVAKASKERERSALADRKTHSSVGRNSMDSGDKGGGGGGSDAKSESYAGSRAEAKEKDEAPYGTAEAKTAPAHSISNDGPDRSKLEALISSYAGGYYDTDEGLDVDFFVRELRNGRAVQSITKMRKTYADFNDNGTGNAYTVASSSSSATNMDKGIAKFCDGDEKRIAELRELLEDSTACTGAAQGAGGAATAASMLAQLACCVSVSSIIRVRKQLVNLTDSYGRTPLLIAAANGHKALVELLLASGGDTSIPATYQSSSNVSPAGGYRYNALSLSATGSIRSLLEKALLSWLNRANLDGYLGASVAARSADGNADVLAVLNSLSNDGKAGRRSLVETKSSFAVGLASSLRGGMGLGLNEAYLHTSEEDLQYKDSHSALAAKSLLVLGMREHLQMLQNKNWAYSRSPLAWAVNNGLAEVVRRLLQERADPNETDTTGRTALHEAAALVSTGADSLADAALDCAELLLRASADPNKGSVGSRSPMHELFSKGQDDSSSSFGSVVVTSAAADVAGAGAGGHGGSRAKVCYTMDDGYTAAQRLLRSRRKRRFLRLLLQFGGDSQQLDRMGMSPVHLAARENDAGCVLEMLRYGSAAGGSARSSREGGLASSDSSGGGSAGSSRPSTAYTLSARSSQTPLHIACRAGAAKVIQLLCRWEADPPKGGRSASLPQLVDSQGKMAAQYLTPALSPAVLDTLWSLAHAGAVSKLRTLLSSMQHASSAEEPLDDESDDDDARQANNAAADDDDAGGSGQEGAGLSQKHSSAPGSVYVADSAELANQHTDYGAEQRSRLRASRPVGNRKSSAHEPWLVDGVNAKTRRLRWTPLHACLSGWIQFSAAAGNTAAKRVVSRSNGKSAYSGSASSPTRPAKASNPSSNGQERYQDTLNLLIQNHCYIDGADWQCRTPLMFAAAANLGAAIDVLLAAGSDVFAKDLDGNTALHVAYAFGSAGAVATLEGRMGASKDDIANYAGQTPFDIAGDVMRVKNLLV